MVRLTTMGAALMMAIAIVGCRVTYVAPPARELPPVRDTGRGADDGGDAPAIREAESRCRSQLSPRAVASAFRAVDEVADALLDLCTIGIVDDDPLVWHVWCGSDALFGSGHYLPPSSRTVSCDGQRVESAFECMGRIVGRHLLTPSMSDHVHGVELVSVGSVDRQPINMTGQFVRDPCLELQEELGVPASRRWAELAPGDEDTSPRSAWNQRLSWCRAAYSALQLRRGFGGEVSGRVELAAIGAGTDWLDHWREVHGEGSCPTPTSLSGERLPGQCRDARRVDVWIRVRASEGSAREEACAAPQLRGGASAEALYCYADCSARAAVGRNPHRLRAPASPQNLLFGQSAGGADVDWIMQTTSSRPLNVRSIRSLMLGD